MNEKMTDTEDNVEDIRMEADEDDMVHNEVNHDSIENDKIHDEDNQLLKNKKLMSMSLKDADKQRQSIKSVTQKLKRETAITNIPYHKSKIFSLKEFMSRKTIVKSKHILQQINKQELLYVAKPKMDSNQLEKYSKYLEKRAKEIKSTTVITTPDKYDENDLNDSDNNDDKEMRYSDTITKIPDENFPTLTNFEIEKDKTKPIEINLDDKKPIIKSLSISEIAKISNTKKYEEKPENSRIKLKKQLKRLIAQKREIEIKKKIENKFKEDKTEFEKNEEYDVDDDDYDGEDEEEDDNYSEVENDEESNENIKVGKNWNKIDEMIEENNEQDVEIENDENDEINTEDLEDIDTNIPTLSSSPSDKQKNIISDNILMSQMPKNTQTLGEDDEEELANLCSGTFSMNAKRDQKSLNCRKLEDSSEDESYDDNVSSKKKQRKRLVISDDSASDDEDTDDDGDDDDKSKAVNFENNSEKNQPETDDEEECETYIDYDSEENEIEVKLTKNECLEKASDFLEKEAELSGSEWNSADEDEKDLDKYDTELLGDEDEFDADKLRDEIGRIHMRKILDEDIRQVKKIQEMIFDDEENDGIGRQRQFRWNVNNNDFLSVDNNDQTDLAEGIIENEDEQEKFCRKIRYEREQLLKEKMEHQIQNETENKLELQGIGGKKLTIMSKTKSYNLQSDNFSSKKLESSFLITKIEKKNVMRRSFLERDQEILPKLCSLTNNENEDEISHKKSTSKCRNFVFPVLSGNNGEI